MPPQYKDFSKSVTDILTDDFGEKKFLKAKNTTPAVMGGAINVTSEVSIPNYNGKVSGKWKHSCGFSVDKLSFDNKKAQYEASMSKLARGVVVKAAGDLTLADPIKTIETEYADETVAAAFKTDSKFDAATASVVLGHNGTLVGGSVTYKSKEGGLSDYPLSIGHGNDRYFAAITAEDKLRKFGLAVKYSVNDKLTVAVAGQSGLEFSKGSPNKVELGAVYVVDQNTKAKAKYAFADGQKSNNSGSIEAAVNTTPLKKVNLSCGIAFPLSDLGNVGSYKYGAGITLG